MLAHEDFGHGHHILGLGVEQADRLDVILEAILAQIEHVLRRLDDFEQRPRRLVDADIGRLRRQRDGDQQLIRVAELQFRLRVRVGLGKAAVEFEDVGGFHEGGVWLG
jgi:hypothetical protein